MLTLLRHSPRCPRLRFIRSFAEVVSTTVSQGSQLPVATGTNPTPQLANAGPISTELSSQPITLTKEGNRVLIREDHGLYGFFRKRTPVKDEVLEGESRYETLGGSLYSERAQSGRSWKASELRLKSFNDLHTLWYVLLRERNVLATQEEEVRRLGVLKMLNSFSYKKRQCRKSMARIKAVINERRLAFEGALQLAEKEKQDHLDNVVLQHQVAEFKKERTYLKKRRVYMEKKQAEIEAAQAARSAEKAAIAAEEKAAEGGSVATESVEHIETVVDVNESPEDARLSSPEPVPPVPEKDDSILSSPQTSTEEQRAAKAEEEVKPEKSTAPETASEAATAGLFGNVSGRNRR
ncbi:MRP-L47-domain-containing protein [Dendrothele bispora CBS 962.96]|uniref:Large ribosomal subunit protein uL29m n=1 Tax=Dendrothele bispora (strain CBS 962.96) TaxID=1314807 RepID=A0A4S8LF01_DENBC|nr:MRP-L47-domain-containing protein [Dendrothele bispora CBS 962.96]